MYSRLSAGLAALLLAGTAHAAELRQGGKLLLTNGITSIDGSAGGGLASWAVIAGNETRDGIGGSAHVTLIPLPDFRWRSYGAALGVFDRLELSYARQLFDTGHTGALLGLGRGFTFRQDVFGAKLRIVGDAVYDQDRILPQIAVGIQHKRAADGAIARAVGARRTDDTEFYVAATKLLLRQSLLLNATVRWTRANQDGLLGFGGDREAKRRPQIEASAAYMLSTRLAVGGEYRSKPDNLGFAKENDWFDAFAAYAINRHLTATIAYVDLGSIATRRHQRGAFLSLQAGF